MATSQSSSTSDWDQDPERQKAAATSLIHRWAPDPVLCSREVFGLKLWGKQAEIAESVHANKRTAAKSGHKIGKSTLAAFLGLWWCLTRWRGRAIFTAPAGHQLTNIIWPEVQRLYRSARFPIGGHCSPDPFRGLSLPGDRGIICVSTDKPEKLAGLSGPNQLFVVDEASGYPQQYWPAIKGNLAGGGRLAAFGNPTQTAGEFFDAFANAAELWSCFTVSSADTPNVVSGERLIPGLAERDYIREQLLEQCGIRLEPGCSYAELIEALERAESPILDVRVKGRFPTQGSNAVIGVGAVEAALARRATTPPTSILEIGVDVARFGDDESVVQPRRGLLAYAPAVVNGFDNVAVAGLTKRTLIERRKPGERARIKVDESGNGSGVVDLLRAWNRDGDLGPHVEIIGVNVACNADDESEFVRLRDQLWWAVRLWLAAGGALPKDDRRDGELTAVRYGFDARGRILVEPKEKLKKRIGRSPDRADALALCVYEGGTALPVDTDDEAELEGSRWDGYGRQAFG